MQNHGRMFIISLYGNTFCTLQNFMVLPWILHAAEQSPSSCVCKMLRCFFFITSEHLDFSYSPNSGRVTDSFVRIGERPLQVIRIGGLSRGYSPVSSCDPYQLQTIMQTITMRPSASNTWHHDDRSSIIFKNLDGYHALKTARLY